MARASCWPAAPNKSKRALAEGHGRSKRRTAQSTKLVEALEEVLGDSSQQRDGTYEQMAHITVLV